MKLSLFIVIAGIAFLTSGCKRDLAGVADYAKGDSSFAYIKIIQASPNFRTVFGARDTFNVLFNGQKINAPLLSYNSIYPFSVNTTTNSITATYAAVTPGPQQVKFSIPGLVNADSVTIYTFNQTLQPAKFYTFFINDSLKLIPDSAKLIQDVFPPTVTGYINLRFIHAALNDTAGKNVDVFSYARNTTLFTNIRPGLVTGFSLLANNIGVADTFYVTRSLPTGTPSTTPLSARFVLAKIAANGTALGTGSTDRRSFTLYYKGDATSVAGTKGRSLAFYINR